MSVHESGGLCRVGSGYTISRLGWVGLGRVQCQKCLINMQFTSKNRLIVDCRLIRNDKKL